MSEVTSVERDYQAILQATKKNDKSTMFSVDDFLKMLAAQLSNQDMMNPMSDADFMGQMAQFTSLETMQELSKMTMTSYSVGLLGKEVTVARVMTDGSLFTKTGTVSGVGLFDGDPIIYIGDDMYKLSEIMAVGQLPAKTTDTTNTGGTDTGSDNP